MQTSTRKTIYKIENLKLIKTIHNVKPKKFEHRESYLPTVKNNIWLIKPKTRQRKRTKTKETVTNAVELCFLS
jgi:hypothetical protein